MDKTGFGNSKMQIYSYSKLGKPCFYQRKKAKGFHYYNVIAAISKNKLMGFKIV